MDDDDEYGRNLRWLRRRHMGRRMGPRTTVPRQRIVVASILKHAMNIHIYNWN
jgi:hypothetical protein